MKISLKLPNACSSFTTNLQFFASLFSVDARDPNYWQLVCRNFGIILLCQVLHLFSLYLCLDKNIFFFEYFEITRSSQISFFVSDLAAIATAEQQILLKKLINWIKYLPKTNLGIFLVFIITGLIVGEFGLFEHLGFVIFDLSAYYLSHDSVRKIMRLRKLFYRLLEYIQTTRSKERQN